MVGYPKQVPSCFDASGFSKRCPSKVILTFISSIYSIFKFRWVMLRIEFLKMTHTVQKRTLLPTKWAQSGISTLLIERETTLFVIPPKIKNHQLMVEKITFSSVRYRTKFAKITPIHMLLGSMDTLRIVFDEIQDGRKSGYFGPFLTDFVRFSRGLTLKKTVDQTIGNPQRKLSPEP